MKSRPDGFHGPPARAGAARNARGAIAPSAKPTPEAEAGTASAQDERSGRIRIGRPGSTRKAVVGRHALRRGPHRQGHCRRDTYHGERRRYARDIANRRRIIASAGAASLAIGHFHSVGCRHGHLQVRDRRARRVNDRSCREQGDEDSGKDMSEPFHARGQGRPALRPCPPAAPAAPSPSRQAEQGPPFVPTRYQIWASVLGDLIGRRQQARDRLDRA